MRRLRPDFDPNVLEALRAMVMAFGVERLATQAGQSPGVIYHKINTNESSHHVPTLPDFLVWQRLTGDCRPLHAAAMTLGQVCIPVPDLHAVNDEAILELVLKAQSEFGQFAEALRLALQQRRFSEEALKQVATEGYQAIAAILETVTRLEGYVDG